jgi:hypothetical protein
MCPDHTATANDKRLARTAPPRVRLVAAFRRAAADEIRAMTGHRLERRHV